MQTNLFSPKSIAMACALAFASLAGGAHAVVLDTFEFTGTSAGGTGSATMDVSYVGTALTVEVNNTSPINLDNEALPNSPGITGFGFDLDPETLILQSWSLTADAYNANTQTFSTITIGSSGTCTGCDWSMGTFLAGLSFEYLPNNGGVADGALFNPLAVANSTLPGGNNDVFFTTATLVMNFNTAVTGFDDAPIIRMQNVGKNGGGSLKLQGSNDPDVPPITIPEPASLALLGLGLVGLAATRRRKA